MTQDEAFKEARRRWGTKAYVERREYSGDEPWWVIEVGFLQAPLGRVIRGTGRSWEEAFYWADKMEEAIT